VYIELAKFLVKGANSYQLPMPNTNQHIAMLFGKHPIVPKA